MNEISRARIKLLVVLLAVVALVHVLIFKFFVIPAAPEDPDGIPAEPEVNITVQPRQNFRFRKLSDNPNFGTPFRRESAVDGNLANLPLSRGATSGFLVDLGSREVLWMKDPQRSVPIASMVKMMTLLVAFESLEDHPEWNLDTPVKITSGATKVARTGIIWLDTRETLPLRELLMALTIKSANDAAWQVAEFTGGGDVNAFVRRMNERAAELGMPGTNFINPNGLPNKSGANSLSTAEGMVILGERLLEYPDILGWTSTQQTFIRNGKTELTNTNNLVRPRWPGVDGLKTGYTRDAGFCLTFTCLRDGRRLLGCVTGFKTARDRDRFVRKLLDWGFERSAEIAAGKKEPPAAGPVTSSGNIGKSK